MGFWEVEIKNKPTIKRTESNYSCSLWWLFCSRYYSSFVNHQRKLVKNCWQTQQWLCISCNIMVFINQFQFVTILFTSEMKNLVMTHDVTQTALFKMTDWAFVWESESQVSNYPWLWRSRHDTMEYYVLWCFTDIIGNQTMYGGNHY